MVSHCIVCICCDWSEKLLYMEKNSEDWKEALDEGVGREAESNLVLQAIVLNLTISKLDKNYFARELV